jgi:diguanylate cyclase (GGDEF)-like protein
MSAAVTDPLTSLPNRRGLEQLVSERRGRRSFAVLAIDIDNLKRVNDRHGHAVGDELLVLVAEAVQRALREGDVLARTGGDELVVFTFDADEASACAVAQRALDSVRSEHRRRLEPRISIRVACGSPEEAPDDVLRRADTALYRAKRDGSARYEVAEGDPLLTGQPERPRSAGPLRAAD